MVSIAYLVLSHKDPELLRRLALRLTKGTDNHVFVHVDKKTPLIAYDSLLNGIKQVHFIEERIDITWGGFNSVIATLNLFKEAVGYSKFDRYVILQGLDYPIKSNKYIDEFFERNRNIEFINALSTNDLPVKMWHKYILPYFMDVKPCFWVKALHKINGIITKYLSSLFRNPVCVIKGKKCRYYHGAATFALTHAAVQYIIDISSDKNVIKQFVHTYTPDESFFHTIIHNSEFVKNVYKTQGLDFSKGLCSLLNLTYFEYPDKIKIFKEVGDIDFIRGLDYLYIRKVTSESKELLDLIDNI